MQLQALHFASLHTGQLTKGSASSGTTSVTITRGYSPASVGSYSALGGTAPAKFYHTSTSGVNNFAQRNFLFTSDNNKLSGLDSITVSTYVSGAHVGTAVMAWVTEDPENGADTTPRYYVADDPFGFRDNVTYPANTVFTVVVGP